MRRTIASVARGRQPYWLSRSRRLASPRPVHVFHRAWLRHTARRSYPPLLEASGIAATMASCRPSTISRARCTITTGTPESGGTRLQARWAAPDAVHRFSAAGTVCRDRRPDLLPALSGPWRTAWSCRASPPCAFEGRRYPDRSARCRWRRCSTNGRPRPPQQLQRPVPSDRRSVRLRQAGRFQLAAGIGAGIEFLVVGGEFPPVVGDVVVPDPVVRWTTTTTIGQDPR